VAHVYCLVNCDWPIWARTLNLIDSCLGDLGASRKPYRCRRALGQYREGMLSDCFGFERHNIYLTQFACIEIPRSNLPRRKSRMHRHGCAVELVQVQLSSLLCSPGLHEQVAEHIVLVDAIEQDGIAYLCTISISTHSARLQTRLWYKASPCFPPESSASVIRLPYVARIDKSF